MMLPSPARQPPPTKKHRAVAPSGDHISNAAQEAIARRRAELRRLQQLRAPNNNVLAMARSQLGPPAAAPPPAKAKSQSSIREEVPPPRGVARVRHSDLFPNAPKLANSPVPAVARTLEFPLNHPHNNNSTSPRPESPGFLAPTASSRAKSAPPMRPPPPPLHQSQENRVQKPQEQPDRTRTRRPPPTPYYPKAKSTVERPAPVVLNGISSAPRQSPPVNNHVTTTTTATSPPEKVQTPSSEAASTNGVSFSSIPKTSPEELNEKPVPFKSPFMSNTPTTHNKTEPTLVEETPLFKSPFPFQSPPSESSPTHVHTPEEKKENSPPKSNDLRLVQELKHATVAKKEALQKVARLEKDHKDFCTLLQIAEEQGEKAALAWAKNKMGAVSSSSSSPPRHVGFLSPVKPSPSSGSFGPLSPLAMQQPTRRRVATPHPKRRDSTVEQLKDATRSVPHEYLSDLASFEVRRPFSTDNHDIWDAVGTMTRDEYQTCAKPSQPESLEIMARIQSDQSILVLSGTSTVRHGNGKDGEWKTFLNPEEKPLGCVMYIDGDANEKEYWLDAIYEEAVATREAYCSSLVSTALALQASSLNGTVRRIHDPVQPSPVNKQSVQPQTVDACVSTEDLPASVPTKQKDAPVENKNASVEKPKQPVVEEEEDAASDVMSVMAGLLLSSIFSLVWFVLVGLPWRIFKFSFLMAVAIATFSALWLYVADDHGAQAMGARIDFYSGGVL